MFPCSLQGGDLWSLARDCTLAESMTFSWDALSSSSELDFRQLTYSLSSCFSLECSTSVLTVDFVGHWELAPHSIFPVLRPERYLLIKSIQVPPDNCLFSQSSSYYFGYFRCSLNILDRVCSFIIFVQPSKDVA
jgi:hypothetical protein